MTDRPLTDNENQSQRVALLFHIQERRFNRERRRYYKRNDNSQRSNNQKGRCRRQNMKKRLLGNQGYKKKEDKVKCVKP